VSPVARRTDPETSHAAAASVGDVRLTQAAVLRLFERFGPMTDEELVIVYEMYGDEYGLPPQSSSGLRTRRKELVDRGLIEYTGMKVELTTGRYGRLWQIPPRGE
jgi:hypothetical protein